MIPTSDRTNGHSVATVQRVLSRRHRYARTHAQDAAQHTCRHVKSVRFICTLSDEGIIASPGWGTGSPPFCILLRVPKWGGGNRAGNTLVKNLGQTGSTATPESLKWNLFLRWKIGQWWKESLVSVVGREMIWLSVMGDCWIIVQRWPLLWACHLSKRQSRAEI